ncbi:MAG: nitrous oxide reductase family maturation protein NosD [Chitinophagaceae bacterium]|nr:nitrous oxide reductase family maturation protein NosD [Chitinophagaceae bacterium]
MKIIFSIISLCVLLTASARTLRVGPSQSLRSLKQALQQAADGDTILVDAGLYKEGQLTINKKVVLRGINFPVFDGERKYEIFTIRANDVLVEGFVFRNSGRSSYNDIAAVRIADSRRVTIRNNKFENSFFGIYSQHATACTISNNDLRSDAKDEISSGNGIHCWKSDSMQITGNYITGHRDGIYFEFVTNSGIRQNHSTKNVRYGLHFMFSNTNSYISNRFIDNGAGVAVMYSKGISMYHNTFAENWGTAAYGILMKDITDSHVEGNTFKRNTVAVMMEGSNRINLYKNSFENNGWALKIQASCMENNIKQNNFQTNSFDVATNGELMLNKFQKNYWDKYDGYDLNRNGIGDVPYRPVSMYSMISERNNSSMMLYRSFIVGLLDKAEKMLPVITPVELKDDEPLMKPIKF